MNSTENQLKEAFIQTFNNLIENKEAVINDCENLILELTDTSLIEEKEIKLQEEQNAIYNSLKELIEQNSRSALNQQEYSEKYRKLRERYSKITENLSKLEELKCETRTKKHRAIEFIENLKQSPNLLTDFDENPWNALVERAIVNTDGSLKFEFKNGEII